MLKYLYRCGEQFVLFGSPRSATGDPNREAGRLSQVPMTVADLGGGRIGNALNARRKSFTAWSVARRRSQSA